MARGRLFAGSLLEHIAERVHITTSGVFTVPPFAAAVATFGIDRIMFSVDYPYSANADGQAFLAALPIAASDKAKLAHANAEALLRLGSGS
jgi:predicted TIM-barrel fold metal-dependent hydrolase